MGGRHTRAHAREDTHKRIFLSRARARPDADAEASVMATTKATTSASGSVRGYWDASEEGALRRAVQKHGIGAWEKMRNDPEFNALRCV